MLNARVKTTVLRVGKWTGMFRAARWLTRDRLRILCYHGIAAGDVAEFRPQLFIDECTFAKRLRYLEAHGFRVLGLEEALQRLGTGTLPADATVITIDDGFASTHVRAVELLAKRRMPATLYVTTYYAMKGTPVFRLLVQYAWWKTGKQRIELDALDVPGLGGSATVGDDREKDPLLWRIIEHGESALEEPQRQALAARVGDALEVDLRPVTEGRWLGLMSAAEIREAAMFGIDIQLHTHRHRFPEDEALARREVVENRAVLEPLVGRPLRHLCYPSGVYSKRHFGWLAEEGILTATTCEASFVGPDAHPLELPRVFDGSHVSQLEFEAEMNGVLELGRRARKALRRVRASGLRRRDRAPASAATKPPASPVLDETGT